MTVRRVLGTAVLYGAWCTLAVMSQRGSVAAQASDPEAEALIDRWIEAVGGMERFWSMRTATFTLTTEMYDADTGRLRRTRPRYVTIAKTDRSEVARIERWEGDDFIEQGHDGRAVWATRNGEPLAPGDRDLEESLYVSRDAFYWISLPFKLRDPGVYLHDRGTDQAGRQRVSVTWDTDAAGERIDAWTYLFEDGRSVPTEVHYIEQGSTELVTVRWEDFRNADGYVYPERRLHYDAQGRVYKVIRTHDLIINPEVNPAVFRRP